MDSIPIMLVDDNQTFLRVTAEFLEANEGITIIGTAKDGREALAQASELRPQIILIDLAMPGMPGLEAIPLLQRSLPETKIIALTVMNSNNFREAALAVGADAFISKANMRTDLLPTIQRLVEGNSGSPPSPPSPANDLPTSHRILIVEDNEQLRRLYTKALKKAGYQVHEAGTMEEARSSLAEECFDLLLCDIHMGDGRSTDLLDEYSTQLFTSGAQVVMVSGQPQYRSTCKEMGIDFFLEKPVAVPTLIGLVDRLTARHEYDPTMESPKPKVQIGG